MESVTKHSRVGYGCEVFIYPDTNNMMTKSLSEKNTVMRLQPFVFKPIVVLPVLPESFRAMSGVTNFLPKA